MKRIITLTTLAALTFALTLGAAEKGAERLNALGKPVVVETAKGAPAMTMTCATETRSAVDRTARGAHKPATLVTAHLCPTCSTKTVSKGVGKMAAHSTVHSCKAVAAACCK